jgi:uncharacterized damage-inducible protein DinB
LEQLDEVWDFLDRIRGETLARLAPLTQAQLDELPQQEKGERAWSLGEVFMHLALDEIYLRELIARPLLEGVKPPEEMNALEWLAGYASHEAFHHKQIDALITQIQNSA